MMPTLIVSVPMLPTLAVPVLMYAYVPGPLIAFKPLTMAASGLDAHAVLELDQAEDVGVEGDECSHQLGVLALVLRALCWRRGTGPVFAAGPQSLPPSSSVRK